MLSNGASAPPQLLEISVAPQLAAASSLVKRFPKPLVSASTSSMRQFGQMADTMSRSSDSSSSHLAEESVPGSGAVMPDWLTLRKQRLAVVHGGRANVDRYTARSASAVGSSKASTIATIWPVPFVLAALVNW